MKTQIYWALTNLRYVVLKLAVFMILGDRTELTAARFIRRMF